MVLTPYALKAVSLKQLLVWECWAEQTFRGQAQLEAQCHILSMALSNKDGLHLFPMKWWAVRIIKCVIKIWNERILLEKWYGRLVTRWHRPLICEKCSYLWSTIQQAMPLLFSLTKGRKFWHLPWHEWTFTKAKSVVQACTSQTTWVFPTGAPCCCTGFAPGPESPGQGVCEGWI